LKQAGQRNLAHTRGQGKKNTPRQGAESSLNASASKRTIAWKEALGERRKIASMGIEVQIEGSPYERSLEGQKGRQQLRKRSNRVLKFGGTPRGVRKAWENCGRLSWG